VKRDRSKWLENLAAAGDWNAIHKLKKGCKVNQSRLTDEHGAVVGTDARADTFSKHLATVQWRVRHVTLVPGADAELFPPLATEEDPFNHIELRKAILGLKSGKATRAGDIPIEFLKALAAEAGPSLQCFLDLCNDCICMQEFPTEWLTSRVVMIFKKGDPGICDNYRPISVLAISYKVVASMLKQRLLNAGLDIRLWHTQYGFRKCRGTTDAIFVARRTIETACAQRNGQVSLLALDWAKAFDSLNVESLLDALRRFGISASIRKTIATLMEHRQFYVDDAGYQSESRPQKSGITQGCTLSPLLFIVVMSALMHDAVESLSESAKAAYLRGDLADMAYADDTLLIGVSSGHLTEFLAAVATAGRRYGMELHYSKFQLLNIQCDTRVLRPDGAPVCASAGMVYLGTVLSDSGCIDSELSRRIGQARSEFRALGKVWRRSTLTRKRRLAIFSSMVETKLYYALSCCCLNVAQKRRLNGFQAKCLRQIMGIAPSFISRVSNKEVLKRAAHLEATTSLEQSQLQLLGKVLRAPATSQLHLCAFSPGTLQPATSHYVRRVGRPKKEWVPTVIAKAAGRVGVQSLQTLANDPVRWKAAMSSP